MNKKQQTILELEHRVALGYSPRYTAESAEDHALYELLTLLSEEEFNSIVQHTPLRKSSFAHRNGKTSGKASYTSSGGR